MSLLSQFKEIEQITNSMMDNVAHLHDSPFTTIKNPNNKGK
jgi:hypothetical protein